MQNDIPHNSTSGYENEPHNVTEKKYMHTNVLYGGAQDFNIME